MSPWNSIFFAERRYVYIIIKFCAVLCGVFKAIGSSTLSLKTCRRHVCLPVRLALAFESPSLFIAKKKAPVGYLFYLAERRGVCGLVNLRLVLCGVFRTIASSTLSLKTVHQTVFASRWSAQSPSNPILS